MSKCVCHKPPAWERPERDSDDESASDWYSGDEAPEDSVGDERMLTRDGEAKKVIQKVGTGQQRPGRHDLVTVHYTAWQVADEDDDAPPEDPLRWFRQGPSRIEELERVEGKTTSLSEGKLPVGVEVCARMMRRGEKALVQCTGRYGMIAAPIFGKHAEVDKRKVPGKLFFKGKLRDSKKLRFLPGCPNDPGQFVFRNRRLCSPEEKLEIEVELVDFLSVQVITDDALVKKVLVSRGLGTRKPNRGDSVTMQWALVDAKEDSVAATAAEFRCGSSTLQTVTGRLDECALPYGRGLARVLTTMRSGERAIVLLGSQYSHPEGGSAKEGSSTAADIRLLCTLVSFRRCQELDVALRSGLTSRSNSGAEASVAPRFLKEELRHAPDDLRVAPMEGGAVLMACKRSEGFEFLAWHLGNGAVPHLWDVAATSMRLYEYAAFRAPRRLWAMDRPTAAYEGRSPLRHLTDCSPTVMAGIETMCHSSGSEENEEDLAPEVWAAIQELVRPGWADSIGKEVEWHSSCGTMVPSDMSGAPDEDQVLFQWLLLAVGEGLDPGEVDDEMKEIVVQRHRGLGNALVKEGSYAEAEAAYTRALDTCRLHEFYKAFFPEEHGEMFRGVSGNYGAQSYQPQLPSKVPDSTFAKTHAWVREAAMACNSNLALCTLRQQKFRECIQHAGRVLAVDPRNAKALFRRGVATSTIGKDLEAALNDLEAARTLQPDDAALKTEIARVREKMKAARKAEKAMFQGILK